MKSKMEIAMSSETDVVIRRLEPSDWSDVRSIYAAGIATGNATFETETPDWETWDHSHLSDLRFIAVDNAALVGWTAASPVSDRCCHSGVIENNVYGDPDSQGRGIGRLLLSAFIEASQRAGVWTIQTGLFPENARKPRLARGLRGSRGRQKGEAGTTRRSVARRHVARASGQDFD
jgi:L-amino acid N-acyltransferase YncA